MKATTLFTTLIYTFSCLLSPLILSGQTTGSLSPWMEGYMDIHHISTGRGNATYFVLPDGTSLLVDAGDISETHPRTVSERNSALKPNRAKSAPGWIVDYIKQFAPAGLETILDYALITHYHDDHFGEWDSTRLLSLQGKYALTGIMAVGDQLPIRTLIDRGYQFPINLKSAAFQEKEKNDEYHIVKTLQEYWKFIDWHKQNNALKNEGLSPGSSTQIVLKNKPEIYTNFKIRNIAVNGVLWTGFSENDFNSLFQDGIYPGENSLSTCIKISYGNFDYFTGGDISGINTHGESDFQSIESHVAPVIGPVDVATLNHHGNRDSQNAFFVRTLRPRVWIGQTWSSDHPGHDVLRRITSTQLYPGERDVFSTDMLPSNELVIGEKIDQSYRARNGHIVIRVNPGGSKYEIFVLNDLSEKREILHRFGPYESR